MSGGNSGTKGGRKTYGGKYLNSMNLNKQKRHIPGTKEFVNTKSAIDLVSVEELDKLIKENISKATMLDNGKMILELPKNIGTWKSPDGKLALITNRITIHNSKTGYHAVPAMPKKGGK